MVVPLTCYGILAAVDKVSPGNHLSIFFLIFTRALFPPIGFVPGIVTVVVSMGSHESHLFYCTNIFTTSQITVIII